MKSLAFKLDFNEYYKYKQPTYFKKSQNYGDFMNNRRQGGGDNGSMDLEG